MTPRTVTHADGHVQTLKRRLPGGRTVLPSDTGRTWHDIVAPWRPASADATGGASARPDHPSRKHDSSAVRAHVAVTPPAQTTDPRRRRERRPALVAAAKLARRGWGS